MGRWIRDSLERLGIDTVAIEPSYAGEDAETAGVIVDRAHQEALRGAGVERASAIVAGTDDDAYNLSIVLNARALNSNAFTVVRQNRHVNESLFATAGASLIMQPSMVTARRILFQLTAPLLKTFFERVREVEFDSEDTLLPQVFHALRETVGGEPRPRLWTVNVDEEQAGAVLRLTEEGLRVTLRDVVRDIADRERQLPCVALVVASGSLAVMPDPDTVVRPGDQILFCARRGTEAVIEANLNNEYTLRYLVTGVDETRSAVLRWLGRQLDGHGEKAPRETT